MTKQADWRAHTRESKLGSALIIAVTVLLVAVGAWYLNGGVKDPASSQTDTGTSATQLAGADSAVLEIGKAAPAFTATDVAGNPVSLADFKGKPVWVNVVATWCQGCRAEMPDVQAAATQYGDKVAVISVFLGEDTQTVTDFAKRTKLDYTLIPDPSSSISTQYGAVGIPAHYFIDSAGNLQARSVGVLSPAQIEEHLQQLK